MSIPLLSSTNRPGQIAWLRRLLVWLLPLDLAFAALEIGAFVFFPDTTLSIAIALTLGYGGCLLVAWAQVRRGQLKAPLTLICLGFLAGDLIMSFVLADLLPALVVLPLLVIVILLPYVDGRMLRFLITVCGLVVLTVAIISEFAPPPTDLPIWLVVLLRISTLGVTVTLILMLLVQFSGQLDETLVQMYAANAALQVTQARLEAQNEWLAVTLQSIGDGVITTDQAGRVALLNNVAETITGWTQADAVGRGFSEICPLINVQTREVIASPIERVLREGALVGLDDATALIARDGTERIIGDSAAPIRDRGGNIIGVVFVFRDITERKRAEDEHRMLERKLLETQKLESLGVLAGGIAHDFNNLLAAILGNAQLALLDLPEASPACESIRQIETASQRAADLTQQMLAYAGKGRFMVQRLDLNELVEAMRDLLHATIAKTATLHYRLAPCLPAIEADASQIRQVLMNLIINAAEAIGDGGGTVTVSTGVQYVDQPHRATTHLTPSSRPGYYVYLEINDSGCGMDEATQAKIFDPFFTTKFTGRGLGLAAVLGIVRSHQGGVKVVSAPGHGTTFTILLPCLVDPAELLLSDQTLPVIWRARSTVLVIDDEELIRVMMEQMLERLGFTVLLASDGRAGVEMFRSHADTIACTLLDMTMPHPNGELTLREIRQIKPDARVVLMSGYDEHEMEARFAGQGLAGFLHKPFTPVALRGKLQQALSSELVLQLK